MTEITERETATGAFIDAGGLRVWYTDQGQRPPLVLVHGGLATGEIMWNPRIVARLTRRYRVLIPDSRAHGRTANPADTLRYGQMADDVAAFCAALGLDRPIIVGYSDGAQVAVELGLRHPDLAAALVVGGVVTGPSEAYLGMLRSMGLAGSGAYDLAQVQATLGDFYDTVRAIHQHGAGPEYWRQISELWYGVPAYTDAQLSGITTPSLVIVGDRDNPSLDDSLRLYRLLPRGELAVVPGGDHGAGDRDVFWDLVEDFLNRQQRKAADG